MEKDAGHRGPILGAFFVQVFSNDCVVVIVTPSGVSVMTAEDGKSIAYRRPEIGDAYTSCVFIPISARQGDEQDTTTNSSMITRECGLVLGTQNGQLELLEVSNTHLKILHQCIEKINSGITVIANVSSVPSVVAIGTGDGRLLLWDPVVHPFTPTVSIPVAGGHCVCSIASIGDNEIWVSAGFEGILVFELNVNFSEKIRTLSLVDSGKILYPQLLADDLSTRHIITDMVESKSQGIVVCLSSEVLLVEIKTRQIIHRYPANLMSCGAAVTCMAGIDDVVRDSTFLILGGVEGSLCIRELNRRERDGKLQCVLLKCYDKLVPVKDVDIPEGCPISSLSIGRPGNICIVGDAACSVFFVNLESSVVVPSATPNVSNENNPFTNPLDVSVDNTMAPSGDGTPRQFADESISPRVELDGYEESDDAIDDALHLEGERAHQVQLDDAQLHEAQLHEALTEEVELEGVQPEESHAEEVVKEQVEEVELEEAQPEDPMQEEADEVVLEESQPEDVQPKLELDNDLQETQDEVHEKDPQFSSPVHAPEVEEYPTKDPIEEGELNEENITHSVGPSQEEPSSLDDEHILSAVEIVEALPTAEKSSEQLEPETEVVDEPTTLEAVDQSVQEEPIASHEENEVEEVEPIDAFLRGETSPMSLHSDGPSPRKSSTGTEKQEDEFETVE